MMRLTVLIVAMLSITCLGYANLLTNADFESGNTGFTSGYTFNLGVPPAAVGNEVVQTASYTITTNPANVHPMGTSFTAMSGTMMYVANASTVANTTAWQQSISVVNGVSYIFEGYIANWGVAADPNAVLEFLANGASLGTQAVSDPPGTWDQFSWMWTADTTGSVDVIIRGTTGFNVGADFALDGLDFAQEIPEPSAMILLGTGLLGLLGYGWRKKQRT